MFVYFIFYLTRTPSFKYGVHEVGEKLVLFIEQGVILSQSKAVDSLELEVSLINSPNDQRQYLDQRLNVTNEPRMSDMSTSWFSKHLCDDQKPVSSVKSSNIKCFVTLNAYSFRD